jgi:hypothetical protein
MTIHQDDNGKKFFMFHSRFEVYGWTDNATDAFTAKGNACIYTGNEFYELMRGRKKRITDHKK